MMRQRRRLRMGLSWLGAAVLPLAIVIAHATMPMVAGPRFVGSAPPPVGMTIFNCGDIGTTAFTAASGGTTPCGVGGFLSNNPNGFNVTGETPSVTGGVVFLSQPPSSGGHIGVGMTFQTLVNVQAFTATYTFIPNGKNLVFVLQNATNNIFGFNGRNFSAGAGCEAGFYQSFDTDTPNAIFGLELDSFSPLSDMSPWAFTYSSAMIYSYRVSPCLPPYTPSWTNPVPAQTAPDKISTSPVPLNSPATTPLTTTGHVYSAKIVYAGTTLTFTLYDVTGGGACPGASCFTKVWTGVDIPTLVGANTAWVGLNGGCNLDCPTQLNVHSFKFVDD